MAHFLRGKQAGIQNDFSGSLSPELFDIDDVCVGPLKAPAFLFVARGRLLTATV